MPHAEPGKNNTPHPNPEASSPGRIPDASGMRTRSRAEIAEQARSLVLQLLSTHFTVMIRNEQGITLNESHALDVEYQVQLGRLIDLVAEGIATDRVLF